jgi:hypothetical protein
MHLGTHISQTVALSGLKPSIIPDTTLRKDRKTSFPTEEPNLGKAQTRHASLLEFHLNRLLSITRRPKAWLTRLMALGHGPKQVLVNTIFSAAAEGLQAATRGDTIVTNVENVYRCE